MLHLYRLLVKKTVQLELGESFRFDLKQYFSKEVT